MDSGDTAWMLASTALVMIMLPGLALFYGGLVRRKNVLSTIMHSFFGLALVSVVWVLVGFSLAFGTDVGGLGPDRRPRLSSGSRTSASSRAPIYGLTIPFILFAAFQMMFAAITPALITGAFAERKRFGAFVLFTILWSILVYSPIAHWVWSVDGWLFKLGALDFAGGTVVHVASGVSALIVAILIGRRAINGDRMEPHDVPMTVLGAGLLWFGWFGFNAGSALTAGGLAANAFIVTNTAAAAATITLGPRELPPQGQGQRRRCRLRRRRGPRRHHAGVRLRDRRWRPRHRPRGRRPLLQRDPAARARVKIDDALDVFAVHGVGGAFGAVATGVFATAADPGGLLGPHRRQRRTGRHPAAGRRRHRPVRRRRDVRDHQGRRCDPRAPRPVASRKKPASTWPSTARRPISRNAGRVPADPSAGSG